MCYIYYSHMTCMWHCIIGGIPSEAHFHCKKVNFSELSSLSDEELKNWLQKTWKVKDIDLKTFQKHKSFPSANVLKEDWKMPIKFFLHLTISVLAYGVMFYHITWIVVVATVFGVMSYLANKYGGGWDTVVLNKHHKLVHQWQYIYI